MKKLLLALLGVLVALPTLARDFEYTYEGQTLTYTVIDEDAKTCMTKQGDVYNPGNSVSGKLVIPEIAKNGDTEYSVISIGDFAFSGCSSLTSVTIPNSVTSIGDQAFSGCFSLSSVTIPNSVTSISSRTFSYCIALTSVTIPNSVTSIGEGAFYYCSCLTSVTIPNSVTSIDQYAFSYSGLTSVTIPESVTSIGDWMVFAYCRSLTKFTVDANNGYYTAADGVLFSKDMRRLVAFPGGITGEYSIPNSVISIGKGAFSGCRLNSVIIPNSITSIGELAFYEFSGLTSVTIPNSVTSIGDEAFSHCSSLTSVTIPNSVISIGEAAFSSCENLMYVTFPNSVTIIDGGAFMNCKALTEVILPPSVETIGSQAFYGDYNLATIIMGHKVKTIGWFAFDGCWAQTVSITSQTPPITFSDKVFSNYSGQLYLQGQAAVDAYSNALCWERFKSYVMIEPTEMKYEGKDMYEAKPGDQFQLTARLMPENVTLPQIFWRSTNPEIATVDCNGLVTIHADLNEVMSRSGGDVSSCKIIAESLYADGPVVEVTINYTSGIDSVVNDGPANGEFDPHAPVEVYNLHGMMVATSTDNLAPGFYIVRQGNLVKKIAVK